MHPFLYNLRYRPVYSGDHTVGGNLSDNQNDQQNQQQQQQQDNGENNQETQFDFNKPIWNRDNENSQNNQQQKQKTPAEIQAENEASRKTVQDFIAKQDLTKGIDFTKLSSDEEGAKVIQDAFNTFSQNMYTSMLQTFRGIMNQGLQKAVDTAVSKATGTITAGNSFSRMHDTLQYTNQPNVRPIAEHALAEFMNGGQTLEEAIQSVDKFMDGMTDHIGNAKQNQNAPRRRPGNGRFDNSENQDESPDWVKYFTGGS